jgi:hypothetical protein
MLEDLKPKPQVFPCAIREIMSDLDENDKTILKDALASTNVWSNRGLARALTERNVPVSERTIRERRLKACSDCVCR